jgi:hypothetical protein
MADDRGSIFHVVVESMVGEPNLSRGCRLTREFVNQLREAGFTYQMILEGAKNLGIIQKDQYHDIADSAPGPVTDAAYILRLIRTNVLRDYAEGIEILVKNKTLTEDIVKELRGDGSSDKKIIEELAAMQAAAGRRRKQGGGGRTRRNSRKRRG